MGVNDIESPWRWKAKASWLQKKKTTKWEETSRYRYYRVLNKTRLT